jgi:branched-chain amino acid transport system ATP-binding protein
MSTDARESTAAEMDADTGERILEISGLEAGYETGQVLFGIDLEVLRGERVSILGRNGVGKTTTMRSIVGTDVPETKAGSIEFKGEKLVGRPAYEISRMGISLVPEDRRCFPQLSVEENIQVAINNATDPKPKAEIFDAFPELDEMRSKHAANTSGGEQQMLSIARALAANPEMMLLDEPSEGLAPFIVRRIEEIIQELNEEEGITILFVEQNAAMAMAVADRHYIIDEGHIVAEVTTEELSEDEKLRQTYLGV